MGAAHRLDGPSRGEHAAGNNRRGGGVAGSTSASRTYGRSNTRMVHGPGPSSLEPHVQYRRSGRSPAAGMDRRPGETPEANLEARKGAWHEARSSRIQRACARGPEAELSFGLDNGRIGLGRVPGRESLPLPIPYGLPFWRNAEGIPGGAGAAFRHGPHIRNGPFQRGRRPVLGP